MRFAVTNGPISFAWAWRNAQGELRVDDQDICFAFTAATSASRVVSTGLRNCIAEGWPVGKNWESILIRPTLAYLDKRLDKPTANLNELAKLMNIPSQEHLDEPWYRAAAMVYLIDEAIEQETDALNWEGALKVRYDLEREFSLWIAKASQTPIPFKQRRLYDAVQQAEKTCIDSRAKLSKVLGRDLSEVPHHSTVARAIEQFTGTTMPLVDEKTEWSLTGIDRVKYLAPEVFGPWWDWRAAYAIKETGQKWLDGATKENGKLYLSQLTPWPFNDGGVEFIPKVPEYPDPLLDIFTGPTVYRVKLPKTEGSAYDRWAEIKRNALNWGTSGLVNAMLLPDELVLLWAAPIDSLLYLTYDRMGNPTGTSVINVVPA